MIGHIRQGAPSSPVLWLPLSVSPQINILPDTFSSDDVLDDINRATGRILDIGGQPTVIYLSSYIHHLLLRQATCAWRSPTGMLPTAISAIDTIAGQVGVAIARHFCDRWFKIEYVMHPMAPIGRWAR